MTLPNGVHQIELSLGKVLARIEADFADKGMAVIVGNREFPLLPVEEQEAELTPLEQAFPVDPLSPVDLTGIKDRCSASVNGMEDWAVVKGTTIQVRIFERDEPFVVPISGELMLPPSQSKRQLKIGLSAHRARASLQVKLLSPSGKTIMIESIPIDGRKIGGKRFRDYHQPTIILPPTHDRTSLTLSLSFEEYADGDNDDDSYLFVANPRVITNKARTYRAITPITLEESESAQDSNWYRAELTELITPDAQIELMVGEERSTLLPSNNIKVELVEDYGYTILLKASEQGDFTIFLDGTPVVKTIIGTDPTYIRFPNRWLTGEFHRLSVRDSAGVAVYLETFVHPPHLLTPEDVLLRESKAPFPLGLSAREQHRYQSMRAWLHAQPATGLPADLPWALDTLEGGYDNVKLQPLRFPEVADPDVSIIIPAHNKVEVTYYALCSLLVAWNKASFEIILVDDGSKDETSEIENIVSGIKVVRNEVPQRFIRACNAGAAEARGKYVVLLNNDTEVTSGWLDALIDSFGRFKNVGLAGSKLLYPNGKLQDAGGIVWRTGNPWNYGNRQNPWDPQYSYARQADYLSGAAMMTTKEIWDEVGGLSSYLEPMYFEDTDFAFKVRDAGYTTWFVPSSVVYHYEGMTSGTDTSTGYKRFQEVNRPKFKRRWLKAFSHSGAEGENPDLEKDRGIIGRILFVDYSTPRPDQDAGSFAALQEIRLVQELGYKVTFLPENLAHFGSYTEELQRNGVEIIYAPKHLSINHFMMERLSEFDAIYVTRYHVANNILEKVREIRPDIKIILNNADLHFLRHLRAAIADNDKAKLAEVELIREQELAAMEAVDLVLSYNDVEPSVIQSHTLGRVKVMKCPWVVELPEQIPAREGRAGLSFLGGFRHHPNVEAIEWFVGQVMPKVAERYPDTKLSVYGSGMGPDVEALAGPNVDCVGYVTDVVEAFDPHLVFVAPLLSGAGIKGKVISAMAHGIPCILSPFAAEGVGVRHENDCLIARTADEWSEAIARLLEDKALWQEISDNARAWAREAFSFESGLADMRAAFDAVELFSVSEDFS